MSHIFLQIHRLVIILFALMLLSTVFVGYAQENDTAIPPVMTLSPTDTIVIASTPTPTAVPTLVVPSLTPTVILPSPMPPSATATLTAISTVEQSPLPTITTAISPTMAIDTPLAPIPTPVSATTSINESTTQLEEIAQPISPTQSVSTTWVAVTPTILVEPIEITSTLEQVAEATVEVTAETLPEETAESDSLFIIEATEEIVLTVNSEATEEINYVSTTQPTPVEEATEEVGIELTEEVIAPLTTISATQAEVVGVINHIAISGTVGFSHNQTNLSAITIETRNGRLEPIDVTYANEQGEYSIDALDGEFYWLIVSSPLHLRFQLGIWPGEAIPDVVLAGGDLNDDGCIDSIDVSLLTPHFNATDQTTSDINADGVTDMHDLAILAGNFMNHCEPTASIDITEPTATDVPGVTSTMVEVTVQPTPELETIVQPTDELLPTLIDEANEILAEPDLPEITPTLDDTAEGNRNDP